MELFGTPPTSPNPFLEDLEDLPPRSPNPPPLPSFFSSERMTHEYTHSFFEPNVPFEQEPAPQEQPPSQPKPLLFHPIYKDIHRPLYEEAYFEQKQPTQPQVS